MAAKAKQLGTDYVVFVNTGTKQAPTWKIPLCQTTLTLNTPKEVIDAGSKCGNDTLVDNGQDTVEFEGQILQKDATNTVNMSLFDLRALFDANEVVSFKAGPTGSTAADAGKIVYEFDGRLTNMSDTYPNKNVATATVSVSVVGNISTSEFVYTT